MTNYQLIVIINCMYTHLLDCTAHANAHNINTKITQYHTSIIFSVNHFITQLPSSLVNFLLGVAEGVAVGIVGVVGIVVGTIVGIVVFHCFLLQKSMKQYKCINVTFRALLCM